MASNSLNRASTRGKSLKRSKSFFYRIASRLRRDPRFNSVDNVMEQGMWEHESIVPVNDAYLQLLSPASNQPNGCSAAEPLGHMLKTFDNQHEHKTASPSSDSEAHTGSDSGHHTDPNEYDQQQPQRSHAVQVHGQRQAANDMSPDTSSHSVSLECASDSEIDDLAKEEKSVILISDHAKSVDSLLDDHHHGTSAKTVARRVSRRASMAREVIHVSNRAVPACGPLMLAPLPVFYHQGPPQPFTAGVRRHDSAGNWPARGPARLVPRVAAVRGEVSQ